jgi:hypothetical protein
LCVIPSFFYPILLAPQSFSLALLAPHVTDLVHREQDHQDKNTELDPHAHALILS